MPQYLVCNYMPDDFDPSVVTEAMMEEIHALNREMIAAGVRKFACGIAPARQREDAAGAARRQGARHRRAVHRDQGAHGRISGYWNALIWTRRWRGRARVPSSAMRRARCASFFSSRLRRKQRNSTHPVRDFGICTAVTRG